MGPDRPMSEKKVTERFALTHIQSNFSQLSGLRLYDPGAMVKESRNLAAATFEC